MSKTETPEAAVPAGRDRLVVSLVAGAAMVGAVAMAASASTLAALGHAVGWTQWDGLMAWVLPVSVDALALVAGAVWLAKGTGESATRLARQVTVVAVLGSVGLNAVGHLEESGDLEVTALWRIGVSTVPPLVAAIAVHLVGVVLSDRRQGPATAPAATPEAPAAAREAVPAPAPRPAQPHRPEPAPAPAVAAPAAAPSAPAPVNLTKAPRPAEAVSAPQSAPQPPARPEAAPAPAVAAEAPSRPQVTTRVPETQAAPARPLADWERPELPAECIPGRRPVLLTDEQVTARIAYGVSRGWTQRRIGEFAGRSAAVVNRRKKEMEGVA
ncbi:DUF2637 domain-containing protein [Streptomyces albidoflavus]|uniref:DUF2637 domain-containing protein n=1 Tax=Streptomyces albidoflavus TaxID=1886 RepID=UPI00344FA3A8